MFQYFLKLCIKITQWIDKKCHHIVLITPLVKIDVNKIRVIGIQLIKIKKNVLLSSLNFFDFFLLKIKKNIINIGVKIPICFKIKIIGFKKWLESE